MANDGIMGWLDGMGTQLGGIASNALGASGAGFVNRLNDPAPIPYDETPTVSDAEGADNAVSKTPLTFISELPIYAKIGAGVVGLFVIYKVLK